MCVGYVGIRVCVERGYCGGIMESVVEAIWSGGSV